MGNVSQSVKSAPAPIPHHDSYSQDHPTLLVVRQKVKKTYPEYTDEAVNQLADLLMNPEAIKGRKNNKMSFRRVRGCQQSS